MEKTSAWEDYLKEYAGVCRKVIEYETGFNHHFDRFYGSEKESLEKEFEFWKSKEKDLRARLEGYMAAKIDAGEWERFNTLEILNNIRNPRIYTGKRYFALTMFDEDHEIEDYYYDPHRKLFRQEVLVFSSKGELEDKVAKNNRIVEITREQAAKIVGDEKYLIEENYIENEGNLIVNEWKPYDGVRKVGL